MTDRSFDLTDWSLFFAVALVWGASFLLIAQSLDAYTPSMVTFVRVGLGAATMWAVRLVSHGGRRIEPADRGRVAVLAMVWVAVPFSLFPLAQQWINSAAAGLLNGATPVLVAVFSVLFYRVAPGQLQLVGLAIGFVGIVAVAVGSADGGSSETRGVLLVLGATVCYGIAINMAGPLQARYGPIVLMSNMLGLAALAVAPFALLDLDANQLALGPSLALGLLGIVGTGLAYWMMTALVGRVGSIRASFITYLIPVVSLALGVALRGDRVTVLALAGAPLVIAGAVLAGRGRVGPSRRDGQDQTKPGVGWRQDDLARAHGEFEPR